MTAQPVELLRIFLFFNMCILISAVAQSLGLLVGALMDLKVSNIQVVQSWRTIVILVISLDTILVK